MDFSKIEKDTLEQINSIKNLDELEKIRLSYLGKKGLISQEMKNLVNLEIDEKKELGKKLNTLKNLIILCNQLLFTTQSSSRKPANS